MALKSLDIVHRANGDIVEGIYDRNEHIRKVVGEVKSLIWGGTRTKGRGPE